MQLAISNSTNSNSTGSDGLNIELLKHLGALVIRYFTNVYNTALNTSTIPRLWKRAIIIPISKPNEDYSIGTNYRPISLLLPIAKILEKTLLSYITENIPEISHQHGFKHKHSTHTALHNICHQITKSFNNPRFHNALLLQSVKLITTWPGGAARPSLTAPKLKIFIPNQI